MSATNTTPNIGLPSFIGTDKPSWLTDWNGAMSTIDTEVGSLKTDLSGDETRIGNLENSVSSLNTTVGNHTTSITALNTQVSNQGGTINTITSLIGNGTPTTTDQTIIGAINELHQDIIDVNSKGGCINGYDAIASVTADGVKTRAQILDDLATLTLSALQAQSDGQSAILVNIMFGGDVFEISGVIPYTKNVTVVNARFIDVQGPSYLAIGRIRSAGGSYISRADISAGSSTDIGSVVDTNGTVCSVLVLHIQG